MRRRTGTHGREVRDEVPVYFPILFMLFDPLFGALEFVVARSILVNPPPPFFNGGEKTVNFRSPLGFASNRA